MSKCAFITGITGQDGSYLAEFLLSKGYKVYGLIRRTSLIIDQRIEHLMNEVELIDGDLLDQLSLIKAMRIAQPDEVYNLAAQSFVQTSWLQPVLTGEYTALSVTKMLEAVRMLDKPVKFYQASSSEMFGKVVEVPQRETTPFYPRSPYGVAKVYGHWITVNYRESYDMFATSGILFNHECVSSNTPLMVRQAGFVNTVTPDELVPLLRKGASQQTFEVPDLEVWDGRQWTGVKAITATRRRTTDADHQMLLIQARGGVVQTTAHHQMLSADYESLAAYSVQPGMHLAMAEEFPAMPEWSALTSEMAEFLGLLTAEGYVHHETGRIQFTNNDPEIRDRVTTLWSKLFLGTTNTRFFPSGFNPERQVGQLYMSAGRGVGKWLRELLYNDKGDKRVPTLILNSSLDIQKAYLEGYYAGDGLKAGNGDSIKTNSELLAQGLCWLYANQGRRCSVYVEDRKGEWLYYQLNISSDQPGNKGQHLRKEAAEVRRVTPMPKVSDEWVFDLETESGVFCAGVGRIVVHNSPRRGLEFVTRKISNAVARIKLGLQDEVRLGNLDSRRDWGFAGDYVKAMWLMLQQPQPEDFVVATGETHAVREFLDLAFNHVGISEWEKYVKIDQRYFRPAEVDLLVGDPTKAREQLGWQPSVSFPELVHTMVEADLAFNKNLAGKA